MFWELKNSSRLTFSYLICYWFYTLVSVEFSPLVWHVIYKTIIYQWRLLLWVLFYFWAVSNDYITTKYSYNSCYLFSGHLHKYDHLFQTATRPVTGQEVGSGIVRRPYLNVFLNVVIWSIWVGKLLRYISLFSLFKLDNNNK